MSSIFISSKNLFLSLSSHILRWFVIEGYGHFSKSASSKTMQRDGTGNKADVQSVLIGPMDFGLQRRRRPGVAAFCEFLIVPVSLEGYNLCHSLRGAFIQNSQLYKAMLPHDRV